MNVSLYCVLFVDLIAAASAPHDVFQAAKAFHVSNTVLAVRYEVTIHKNSYFFPIICLNKIYSFPGYFPRKNDTFEFT